MNNQQNEEVLQVVGLKKHFGDNEILKNITLTVRRGEAAFIIGPSGGGKSTFLRCLNFLEKPSGGSVKFFGDWLCREGPTGIEIKSERELRKARARMPMVFQQFNLFDHRTALENVIEGPVTVLGEARKDAIERAESILKKVGLVDKRHAYPAQLSGGQKQRVGIARAMAMRPNVILFDEPTSALDPELVADVLNTIRALIEEGMTMLIVTHEIAFARNLAHTVYFVEGGIVGEYGPPDQIIQCPKTPRVQAFVDAVLRH